MILAANYEGPIKTNPGVADSSANEYTPERKGPRAENKSILAIPAAKTSQ